MSKKYKAQNNHEFIDLIFKEDINKVLIADVAKNSSQEIQQKNKPLIRLTLDYQPNKIYKTNIIKSHSIKKR